MPESLKTKVLNSLSFLGKLFFEHFLLRLKASVPFYVSMSFHRCCVVSFCIFLLVQTIIVLRNSFCWNGCLQEQYQDYGVALQEIISNVPAFVVVYVVKFRVFLIVIIDYWLISAIKLVSSVSDHIYRLSPKQLVLNLFLPLFQWCSHQTPVHLPCI